MCIVCMYMWVSICLFMSGEGGKKKQVNNCESHMQHSVMVENPV